jgi:hypothetical protein
MASGVIQARRRGANSYLVQCSPHAMSPDTLPCVSAHKDAKQHLLTAQGLMLNQVGSTVCLCWHPLQPNHHSPWLVVG